MEPDNPILPEGLCEAVPPECTKDHGEMVRLAHHWVPGIRVSVYFCTSGTRYPCLLLIQGTGVIRVEEIILEYFRYKRLFMPENKFVYFF